ncbi:MULTISPECIES: metal ABC transporter ATP-binding protein [Pelosinus]|uniref:ABC transporter related protein n=1 Tax=Pelosinus fermentans B4 TaxID=1149862 RepID=I8RH99_9FIRM|nr:MULTISPECIES: metal ABC transporter ATP-binding protein [Pelosinus]EIW17245.1 ABC transporter related protein [Pelosinus fermentans B4]EIW22956.1 ABC transporter related protein [Pelosinus fermentans A11]OAM94003.1 Fe(3+)-transporting ATPase [Pelosinus fermentans DSM 17108]SDQ96867.1 zinc transport system ATP-binding protein [Pelosinus fermentans]
MCEVKLFDIHFSYNTNVAIDNISLTISQGDFVAVVGPNGAGKSTMLKIIAGLIKPTRGQVQIGGKDIFTAKGHGLIGYVPQNYGKNVQGFPATVKEVVALGLTLGAAAAKKNHQAANHITNHMMELVGVENLRDRRIGELSGGQQQRVMVAMALAANPQLLLLDEPTSGIDYEASARIYELLGTLNKNLGITIVMVSHDIEKAVSWANKVACINRKLCFFGSSKEFDDTHAQSRHLWYYTGQ